MIVPVELRHGDLYTTANRKMESLRQWEAAQHESWSQENFLLSIQSTARPKSRILFKHGPDLSLDLVVYRGVEDDCPAEDIRAGGWKISANCALNVPRPEALRGRKSEGGWHEPRRLYAARSAPNRLGSDYCCRWHRSDSNPAEELQRSLGSTRPQTGCKTKEMR